VSAGGNHACAVRNDGTIACWGYGEFGQLGFGGTPLEQPTPVQVLSLTDAVSVEAGAEHTCAVRANASAVCWGSNDFGQLGDGQRSQRNFPVAVQFLTVTGVDEESPADAGRRRGGGPAHPLL
jgi:alpha-tubulin suppressor-like RCC1 family protein